LANNWQKPSLDLRALELDLGHTANVAETIAFRVRPVLRKLDLHGNAANERYKQLVGSRREQD